MIKNKILSVFLLGIFVFTIAFASVSAETGGVNYEKDGANYEKEIQLITALNIMSNDNNGQFSSDQYVKRSEFSESVVKLMGISESDSSDDVNRIVTLDDISDYDDVLHFSDVSESNEYYFYIQNAIKLGLMDGYTDGSFGPDDAVEFQQAVKVLVSILGYDVKAVSRGGYPTGYILTASELGLLKGIDLSYNDEITKEVFAKLIYNALDIDMMMRKTFGESTEFIVEKGTTILTKNLSYKTNEGKVTGNDITRLFDENPTVSENRVQINGIVFDKGNTNVQDLLGYIVRYYYSEEESGDNKTLVAVFPSVNKNKSIDVNYDEIFSCDLVKLKYRKENQSKSQVADLSPALNVIYNGVALTNLSPATFDLLSGNLKLLDADNDGIYEVAFINTYVNYVVNYVDGYDSVIYDKYGQTPIRLSSQNQNVKYDITKDGKKINVDDLSEYDVLSVSASKTIRSADNKYDTVDVLGAAYYKIEVFNSSIEGKVVEINDEECKIGDKIYKISNSYLRATEYSAGDARAIELDSEGKFYLDKENKIAATKLISGSSKNYAYLLNIKQKSGLSSEVTAKLLTGDCRVNLYKLSNKLTINGELVKAKDAMSDPAVMNTDGQYGIRKLINYTLNSDGEISDLNTAVDKSMDLSSYLGYDETTFTRDYSGNGIAYRSGKVFTSRYYVTDSTVIFLKRTTAAGDDEDFIAVKSNFLSFDNSYDIELFDVNKDFTIRAMVIKAPTTIPYNMNSSSISIVERITGVVDENGQNATKVYFMKDGKPEQTVISENNDILYSHVNNWWPTSKNITQLQSGDVIQFTTNIDGKLDNFRVLFSPQNLPTSYFQKENANQIRANDTGSNMNSHTAIYAAYGKVIKVNPGSNIVFNAYNPSNYTYNRSYLTSGIRTYVYDSSNGKVSLASSSEIVEGTNIFIRVNSSKLHEVVIVK